jgi:polyhydroxybutyrate depolymerase
VPSAAPLVIDGPGAYTGEVVSGGRLRRFRLHVPESLQAPAPLVLVFHGFTRTPEDVEELSGMTPIAEREGFVVAYPAALGFLPAWEVDEATRGGADVQFVRDLVAAVSAAIDVDPDRVFATGMSNGGGMAGRLGCDAPDLVAAVAPVAAAHTVDGCDPDRPVPVVAFHGTADLIVPYRGFDVLGVPPIERWAAEWAERNGCEQDPLVERITSDVERRTWVDCDADVVLHTVYGGGHGWPGSERAARQGDSATSIDASDLIWEFFVRHPRS